MKEAILWIGFQRPEYSSVSIESILKADNRPDDILAYVDNDGTERSLEVIRILKKSGIENIIFRETNFGVTPHILLSFQDFFSRGYDICHFFQDDIIISREYFNRAKKSLSNENIYMFCGCVVIENQRNKIYPYFSAWGSSFKKYLYDFIEPHVNPFLKEWYSGNTVQYQINHFGENKSKVKEFDGLFDNVVQINNLLCEYPERSYSKDIGEYGFQRIKGIPPVKTLEEWANEPVKGPFGYGINGIDFKL